MDLWLTLRFRGSPLALRRSFPPELAFLGRELRSLDGPEIAPVERICTAHVRVTPEQAEGIVAWGRMRAVDGRTLLASVSFEERWRARELSDAAVVELARAPGLEAPPVVGRSESYAARWACSHCDRLRLEQVGLLEPVLDEPAEVELLHRARPEVLLGVWGELIVASRLRPLLESHGLELRPVIGTRSWLQVIVEARTRLLATSRESHGPGCPGCGEEPLVRDDGQISDGVRMLRTPHWTVARPLPPGVPLAWSEQRIGYCGAVHDGPAHPMGGPVDLALVPELLGVQGAPVLLASPALACVLADAEAAGLEVRPVHRAGASVPEHAPRAALARVPLCEPPGTPVVIDRAQPAHRCAQHSVTMRISSPGTRGAPDFRCLAVHA
ncbi:MAG TPA: hypothetical protein VLQ79_08130 [Myxococcaceae bacterium]|nr:hypothetical protein [Myxococcaceae bacterium]